MRHRERGFNLIELLVTLTVMAVVITMGAPALTNFINDMRLSATTNDLLAYFNYARSEAAKRGARVTVCVSADQATCATTESNWAVGAVTFVDTDNDGQVDTGETVLRVLNPMPGATILATSAFSTSHYFYYRPSGAANSQGTLQVCRSGRNARDVSISNVGRPMSQATTTVCP
ncbi:MAG TPA: GspH/FimT family pseudopilin [Burkholderiales bacterium]|nr:GspH/FimT family pseudopilin [Burkholderiales bacterium]